MLTFARGFERLAEERPLIAGTLAALVMVVAFGIAGGIECGHIWG